MSTPRAKTGDYKKQKVRQVARPNESVMRSNQPIFFLLFLVIRVQDGSCRGYGDCLAE